MEPTAKRRKTTSRTSCGDPIEDTFLTPNSEVGGEQDSSSPSPFQIDQISLNNSSSNIICFGMLNIPTLKSLPGPQPFENVDIRQGGEIFSSASDISRGSIRSRHAQLLELFRTEHIDMDLAISSIGSSANTLSRQCALQVILYGDKDLSDGLKEVLRSQNLFLQDPYGASRDVLYWNPQRYCNFPETRTSHFHSTKDSQKKTVEQVSRVDSLAAFTSGDDLPETAPSSHVRTSLKPHQKQALSFMISRERGWNFGTPNADLWSLKQNNRQTSQEFVNNVSGASQYVSPPDFRGGILADSMGYGKTLSMIALIAHDRNVMTNKPSVLDTKTTLVVVPPSLLDNWRNDLSSHLYDATLVWASHHGLSKISTIEELRAVDIVLTTYPTAVTEWRKRGHQSVLFSHHWHRIILDEAHYIKNPSTATSKAVCHIQSTRRWAVTGTPIQNSPSDLQSILRFIKAYPYSDKAIFDDDINRKLKSGEEEEAVNRLKRLLSFLMLRRSSTTVLPPRKDFIQFLEFDSQELEAYRQAAEMALVCINNALQSSNAANGYINTLQKITTLRRICNLGHLNSGIDPESPNDTGCSKEATWDQIAAQRALDQFLSLGLNPSCVGCQQPMDIITREPERPPLCHLTQCCRLWCAECFNSTIYGTSLCYCEPKCHSIELRVPSPKLAGNSELCSRRQDFPVKIRALITDLRQQPSGSKSVVFSFWKSTLDLAHAALTTDRVPCVQVDGTVPGNRRWELFDQFRRDSSVRVLLLTLSCGAVGLNLTAASRAYLMEPQWNPTLEEQALSRIHRIGQTRPVTTVRFIMDNSIEQVSKQGS
ncbi:putative SWI/SNF-related matrix-associated actin-dependent regulator of chromatin subfamily A member 3-like 1 [Fusarium oxysporum f. sp. rapae]|uniref:Putative SWI/SNF-related matrix-associated actin-dependent regulator of chromatin subfamily A member 3-like 1 n=1 Tax=Fusarium oxysporum f. sp. rapae TaxID=485398 RepID=A0A8J5NED9_FUSOX|nr:putative SWI/SNF-related matrix-associated actin-dependent regulator of chromatin subfamily A member 3-like 1 [Fusarium oxysporum f. sp. rapae]